MSTRRSSQRFSFRSRLSVATRKLTVSTYHQALRLARIVDKDGLELGEKVKPFLRHFPLAHAGGLSAAEGKLGLAADGRFVDMDHARFHLFDEFHDGIDVLGENRSCEAIFNAISETQRVLQ